MADTDDILNYTPKTYPQLGDDRRYMRDELHRISQSIDTMRRVMVELETRLAAIGG